MNSDPSSKKRILFVLPSLIGGGAERVLLQLIKGLDKDRYDLLLIIFEDTIDYEIPPQKAVEIICLRKKRRWDFFEVTWKLRQEIGKFSPDIVISALYYANIVTVIASCLRKRSFRILLCEHSYPRKYLQEIRLRHIVQWLIHMTYKKADKFVAVSKSINQGLSEDFGIESSKIETIYNPVDVIDIQNKSKDPISHPFFNEKNGQVMISVGRLVKEKRFDRLLRAFDSVQKRHNNVYLIILGKGELFGELARLRSELALERRVDFPGYQSNPYAWIAKSDIFVLSSDYEGLPVSILEAMSCGVPVISTDCVSGPGEIITNGKNGVLVETNDETALAGAMLKLLMNHEMRRQLAREGLKRARDFDLEKIIASYEAMF
jgi:glycosyltransferase involved in cell wall biosynthesis